MTWGRTVSASEASWYAEECDELDEVISPVHVRTLHMTT